MVLDLLECQGTVAVSVCSRESVEVALESLLSVGVASSLLGTDK
jgi:hypothetical protein